MTCVQMTSLQPTQHLSGEPAKTGAGAFPGGPVVKSPSCNAGKAGSIPGQGTKIQHAAGQLSPRATTREKPTQSNERSCVLQVRPNAAKI